MRINLASSKTVLLLISIMLAACLFSADARSDMCVISTDDYPGDYSGEKVCTGADTADGTEDDIINLEFYAGSDIEVDVVFQQGDTKHRVELYNQLMYYDTANMTLPITCVTDPSNYFKDFMAPILSLPYCWGTESNYAVDNDGTRVIAEYEMNFSGDIFPAAGNEPDSFVMDRITFTNDSYTSGDTYEYFDFATTGGAPTDVGIVIDGKRCSLFNLGLDCGEIGIATAQVLLKSKVTIMQAGGSVGTPSVATPTCKGNTGCTAASGTATFSFNYALPTTCYADSSCSTTSDKCSDSPSVVISDGTNTYQESDGVYTETVNVGDVISGYTVYGDDSNLHPSTNLNCSGSETGTVIVPSVVCKCGDPPVVSLADSDKYGDAGTGTWFNKRDIKIDFSLTDPDAEEGSGLPGSVPDIKFYFTNDLGETTHYYDVNSNTKTALNADGDLSAIIDGEKYVRCGTDIYFGIIAIDEMGLMGEYPAGFACESDTSCDWTDSSKYALIDNDGCVTATNLFFTEEPFPNQLPFRAGPDSLLKIYFNFSGEADVTMRIYSMDGALIRQIGSDRNTQVTSSMERADCMGEACNFCNYATGCAWDGTNMSGGGNYVTNGMYVLNIHAAGAEVMEGQEFDYTKALVVMK